jgi:patatin-related protein
MPDLETNSIQLFPQVDDPPIGTYDRAAEPLYGRNLRIALAMRGGVSLAVWIGGAVGELDLLRRIRWTADGRSHFLWPTAKIDELDQLVLKRARVYALALQSRGYDRVEYDALAGASAGGLNSILYSVAQRAGAKLDSVLGVWVQDGAFWSLMRGPGFRGLDSPLDGDGFFAPGVKQALETLRGEPADQVKTHVARHIVVDLSATVIDTQDAGDRVSRSGRGEFHFVGAERGPTASKQISDLKELGRSVPTLDAPDSEISLARLAYAARSTSSLPGGFEPALIYSSYSNTDTNIKKRIDFSYAFHVQRKGFAAPFRVVDGGLTDNMPIDRAFRAVRGLASEVYADRAIIYLDPAPQATPLVRAPSKYDGPAAAQTLPLEPKPKPRTDPSSRLLRVIARAFGLRANGENAAEKEQQIDDFRQQLNMAAARRLSTAPLSAAASPLADSPFTKSWYDISIALSDYSKHRAVADANLLSSVLQNPAVWQLESDLPERHSYFALTPLQLANLEQMVAANYLGAPGGRTNAIFAGPLAVIDSCLSLLTWVRAIEDANFVSEAKTARLASIDRVTDPRGSIRSVIYGALDAAARQRDVVLQDICLDVLTHDDRRPPRSSEKPTAKAAADGLLAAPTTAIIRLMKDLDEIRKELADLTVKLPPPVYDRVRIWAGFPANGATSAIEVAAFCAAAGIPDAISSVKFWDISAATPAAESQGYVRLREDDFRLALKSILALPRAKDVNAAEVRRLFADRPLSANAKLTGTALGAFAGFLSGDWRRNDWLWGRLDGASGILEFLQSIDPPRAGLVTAGGVTSVADQRELVQESILQEAWLTQRRAQPSNLPADVGLGRAPFWPMKPPAASTTPDDIEVPDVAELRSQVVVGSDTIVNLSPGYRVGVASRAAHLALRAFGRWSAGLWTVIVSVLLKPILTLVPVVVDVPRALLVGSIIVGLWTVGSMTSGVVPSTAPVDPTSHRWWPLLPIGAAVVVFFAIRGISSATDKWNQIERELKSLKGDDRASVALKDVQSWRGPQFTWAIALFVLAVVVLVLTLLGNALWSLTWPSTFSGLVVGIGLAIASSRRAGQVPTHSGYPVWTIVVTLFAAIALVLAIAWPRLVLSWLNGIGDAFHNANLHGAWWGPAGSTSLPLAIAAVAILLSLVCNWGWQAGFHPQPLTSIPLAVLAVPWWLISAAVAGVFAYAACYVMLFATHSPDSRIVQAVCALVALWVSGTVQSYLTQLQLYTPSDESARRP